MTILKYLFQNIWVGIGRFLLVIHVVVAVIVYAEVKRFWALGLSLIEAQRLSAYYVFFELNIIRIVFLALLIPIAITILKYLFRNRLRARIYETGRVERAVIAAIHLSLVALVVYLYWLYPYMQVLSGNMLFQGELRYVYDSHYYSIISSTYAVSIIALSVFIFVVSVFGRLRLSGKEPRDLITHYNLWLALANPEGDLYPSYSKRLNFNAGAISPEIRYVNNRTRKKQKRYQKSVPGSRSAARYLKELSNRCKRNLFRLVRIDNSQYNYHLEFHTGTSRAIELAVTRMPRPLKVIISPYEHPSEVRVVEWLEANDSSVQMVRIDFDANSFDTDWENQEKIIEARLQLEVNKPDTNYLFVISEVCYATGMIVPIRKVTKKFRVVNNVGLSFLIDGSHSVGNYHGAFADGKLELESGDSYVFGSHKWLLSPEPCGVSLTTRKATTVPYDAWTDDLPVTTVGLAKIGSFLSSLELLLAENRYEQFMSLSSMMKDEFIKTVADTFFIIGQSTNQRLSSMIALKPNDNYQWIINTAEALSAHLSRIGVNCEVIDKGDDSLWVRLTFPYFVTYADIKKLKTKLRASISES